MTQEEIIAYNERHALEQIRAAYAAGDLAEAMQLVHVAFGIGNMKAAYNKVMEICVEDKMRQKLLKMPTGTVIVKDEIEYRDWETDRKSVV